MDQADAELQYGGYQIDQAGARFYSVKGYLFYFKINYELDMID